MSLPEKSIHGHHERKSWPWLVAAFFLCPCHLPILLANFGAGAVGGVLARNQGVLFIALGALSALKIDHRSGESDHAASSLGTPPVLVTTRLT